MVGLINLFLYILKYPSILSALGDVSMLDIAVGHFGLLEVTTAFELSYPFAREVARIAYQTVSSRMRSKAPLARPATPAAIPTAISDLSANHVPFSDEVCVGPPHISRPIWGYSY